MKKIIGTIIFIIITLFANIAYGFTLNALPPTDGYFCYQSGTTCLINNPVYSEPSSNTYHTSKRSDCKGDVVTRYKTEFTPAGTVELGPGVAWAALGGVRPDAEGAVAPSGDANVIQAAIWLSKGYVSTSSGNRIGWGNVTSGRNLFSQGQAVDEGIAVEPEDTTNYGNVKVVRDGDDMIVGPFNVTYSTPGTEFESISLEGTDDSISVMGGTINSGSDFYITYSETDSNYPSYIRIKIKFKRIKALGCTATKYTATNRTLTYSCSSTDCTSRNHSSTCSKHTCTPHITTYGGQPLVGNLEPYIDFDYPELKLVAKLPVYDVSLKKEVVSITPSEKNESTPDAARVGDIVTYRITVTNEGNDNVDSVDVIDTLPKGLIFVGEGGTYSVGPIAPGASADIEVKCEVTEEAFGDVAKDVTEVTLENVAEVTKVEPPEREDDGDLRDTAIVKVIRDEPTYDLALAKFITRGPDTDVSKLIDGTTHISYSGNKKVSRVNIGDEVTYTIRVYNEGNQDLYLKEIYDKYDSGLKFIGVEGARDDISTSDQKISNSQRAVNLSFKGNGILIEGNKTQYPGISMIQEVNHIDIVLKFKVIKEGTFKNIAEIVSFTDEDGNGVADRDSTPNNNANGEDDIDFEKVYAMPPEDPPKYDLALKKFIVKVNDDEINNREPKVDTSPLKNEKDDAKYTVYKEEVELEKGDVVVYRIQVYNEGEIDAKNIKVIDYLPDGLEFIKYKDTTTEEQEEKEAQETLVNDKDDYEDAVELNKKYKWEFIDDDNEKALTTDYMSETIDAFDGGDDLDSAFVEIACIVRKKGTFENVAEIVSSTDVDGNEVDDIDSEPASIDNPEEYDDEDDDDYEKVTTEGTIRRNSREDLAIKKFVKDKGRDIELTDEGKEALQDGALDGIYTKVEEPCKVSNGDELIYVIRIFNEGEKDTKVRDIVDTLDVTGAGLDYRGLVGESAGKYTATYDSGVGELKITPDPNEDIIINGFDGDIHYEDIEIKCKVVGDCETIELSKYEDDPYYLRENGTDEEKEQARNEIDEKTTKIPNVAEMEKTAKDDDDDVIDEELVIIEPGTPPPPPPPPPPPTPTPTPTPVSEYIDISGTKIWEDEDNKEKERPDSITVQLLANGENKETKTVTVDDNWSYSFNNLPKYDSNGKEIKYEVKELNIPKNYRVSYNGYNIINTYDMISTTMMIAGYVFEDKPFSKDNLPNNLYDAGNDSLLEGIEVSLYDKNGNLVQLVQEWEENPNIQKENAKIRTNPVLTDANGRYCFNGLKPHGTYTVKFKYNGLLYETVEAIVTPENAEDYCNTSKAKEGDRSTLNGLFTQINSYDKNYTNGKIYTKEQLIGNSATKYDYEGETVNIVQLIARYKQKQLDERDASSAIGEIDDATVRNDIKAAYGSVDSEIAAKLQFIYDCYLDAKVENIGEKQFVVDELPTDVISYSYHIDTEEELSNVVLEGDEKSAQDLFNEYMKNWWNDLLDELVKYSNNDDYLIASKDYGTGEDNTSTGYNISYGFDIKVDKEHVEITGGNKTTDEGIDALVEMSGLSKRVVGETVESTYEDYEEDFEELWDQKYHVITYKVYDSFEGSPHEYTDYNEVKSYIEENAKDNTIENIANIYNKLMYINLGIKEREQIDLTVAMDVYKAEVTVSGYTQTYNYNDVAIDDAANWIATVKNTSNTYERNIYSSDHELAENFNIEITYRVAISNQSSIETELTNLINFYDEDYTFISCNLGDGKGTIGENITASPVDSGDINVSATDDFNMNTFVLNKSISNQNIVFMYIKYSVNRDANDKIICDRLINAKGQFSDIDDGKPKACIIEVDGFKSADARIDNDSVPGNYTPKEHYNPLTKTYREPEDDVGVASGLYLQLDNKNPRMITGMVWEDEPIKELLESKIRQGNGVYDKGENLIRNVEVVLCDEYGNEIGPRALTDKNGKYVIKGFGAGTYTLKFKYSNDSVSENTYYNGQDYKSTIYNPKDYDKTETEYDENLYWYELDEEQRIAKAQNNGKEVEVWEDRISDARDIWSQREVVNNYSKTLTNEIAETIDPNYFEYYTDEQKVLAKAKTEMHALTEPMEFKLEYGVEKNGVTNATKGKYNGSNFNYNDDNNYYVIENVDFGLVERPRSQLLVHNNVSNVKVVLADGSILFDAEPNEEGKFVHTNLASIVRKLAVAKVTTTANTYSAGTHVSTENGRITMNMDEELMQGANMQVTYEITVENIGENDYIYNDSIEEFYFKGIPIEWEWNTGGTVRTMKIEETKQNATNYINNNSDKLVTTKVEQIIDYVGNNMKFSNKLGKLREDLMTEEEKEYYKNIVTKDVSSDNYINYKGETFTKDEVEQDTHRKYAIVDQNIINELKAENEVINLGWEVETLENIVAWDEVRDKYINYKKEEFDRSDVELTNDYTIVRKDVLEKIFYKKPDIDDSLLSDVTDDAYNTIAVLTGETVKKQNLTEVGITEALEPGQVAKSDFILTQLISPENESDDLTYKNVLEVVKTTNDVGRRMYFSIAGNHVSVERDSSGTVTETALRPENREIDTDDAELITIIPPFGANMQKDAHYAIFAVILVAIFGLGVYLIKKKVLK